MQLAVQRNRTIDSYEKARQLMRKQNSVKSGTQYRMHCIVLVVTDVLSVAVRTDDSSHGLVQRNKLPFRDTRKQYASRLK